jgi:hypothetical protein
LKAKKRGAVELPAKVYAFRTLSQQENGKEDAAGTKIHPGFSLVKKKVLELGGRMVLA